MNETYSTSLTAQLANTFLSMESTLPVNLMQQAKMLIIDTVG